MTIEQELLAIKRDMNSIRIAVLNTDAWATNHVLWSIGISLLVGWVFGHFLL